MNARRALAVAAALAVLVALHPAATSPAAATPQPAPAASAAPDPEPVVGGGGFNTPSAMDQGSYVDTIALGESLFYSLAREAGEAPSVRVRFLGDAGGALSDPARVRVQLYDDARQPLAGPVEDTFLGDDTATVLETAAEEPAAVAAAGDWLLVVSLVCPPEPEDIDNYEVLLEIGRDPAPPQPTPPTEPRTAGAAGTAPATAAGSPAPAPAAEPGPARPSPLTLLALGLVIGAGLGIVRPWRRSRVRVS